MSDGVRLHSNLSILAPATPNVTSVELSAYPNIGCPTRATNLSQQLSDMMNIVVVSLRGTGASEGVFDMYGPRTQRDITEVLDWIAKQPWSNGRIVLTGYSGTALAEVFAYGNPHVVAAVTGSSCTELYDYCLREGGTLQWQGQLNLELTDATYSAAVPTRVQTGLDANPPPPAQIAAFARVHADEAARDTRDAWWSARSGMSQLGRTTTPVFYTTDNFDIVNAANYASFIRNASEGSSFLTMGEGHTSAGDGEFAGGHSADFGSHRSLPNWQRLIYQPIDEFVRHYAFGAPEDLSNHVTVETTVGGFSSFAPSGSTVQTPASADVVRSERTWPLPGTRWERLYLDGGRTGSVSSLNDGSLVLAPPALRGEDTAPLSTTPSTAGSRRTVTFFGDGEVSALPSDRLRQEERGALTYTTAPLAQNLEVTGPIVLRVFASTNARDFDWYTVLTDVHADGTSEYVSEGILRASLRRVDRGPLTIRNGAGDPIWLWHPSDTHESVPPGRLVEYEVQLQPISNVFRAGDRIRLDVLTTEGQLDSSPTDIGALTVAHGAAYPSSLLLPVIPDRCQMGVPLAAEGPRLTGCAPNLEAAYGVRER